MPAYKNGKRCLNDERCEYTDIASICEGGLNTVPMQ